MTEPDVAAELRRLADEVAALRRRLPITSPARGPAADAVTQLHLAAATVDRPR